jgi:1-acyl-sn-glycerol-3-phosphate acyltransferase
MIRIQDIPSTPKSKGSSLIETLPNNRISISQILARAILNFLSWKLEVTIPDSPKYVMVGAPHTSNFDFLMFLLLRYATGIRMRWIGKHTLFRGPFGWLMRRLDGVPVDRSSKNNFVGSIVEEFNRHDQFVLAIAPEGTRSKTEYWRTGFYYIALGAEIPIALGFVDYKGKLLGIGPSVYPSGDIQTDFLKIQEFYSGRTGKNPQLQGQLKLRQE